MNVSLADGDVSYNRTDVLSVRVMDGLALSHEPSRLLSYESSEMKHLVISVIMWNKKCN